MRIPVSYKVWKECVLNNGNFCNMTLAEKAAFIVRNARFSLKYGSLNQRSYRTAVNWAYRLDAAAARAVEMA